MAAEQHKWRQLELRPERAEKQYLRLRQTGAVVLNLACVVLLMGTICLAQPQHGSTPSSEPHNEVLWFHVYDTDFFSATGKWSSVSDDPKDAPPYPQEVEIDCFKSDLATFGSNRTCMEATAEYYYGHSHISVDYFQVVQWDKNGILALSTSAVCQKSYLRT